MTLGERIKARRDLLRMSRADLGQELSVTEHAIGQYERDDRRPDVESLAKIARVLNTTVGYLMGEEPEVILDFHTPHMVQVDPVTGEISVGRTPADLHPANPSEVAALIAFQQQDRKSTNERLTRIEEALTKLLRQGEQEPEKILLK